MRACARIECGLGIWFSHLYPFGLGFQPKPHDVCSFRRVREGINVLPVTNFCTSFSCIWATQNTS